MCILKTYKRKISLKIYLSSVSNISCEFGRMFIIALRNTLPVYHTILSRVEVDDDIVVSLSYLACIAVVRNVCESSATDWEFFRETYLTNVSTKVDG